MLNKLYKLLGKVENKNDSKSILITKEVLKEISALLKLKEEVVEKEDFVIFLDDTEEVLKKKAEIESKDKKIK